MGVDVFAYSETINHKNLDIESIQMLYDLSMWYPPKSTRYSYDAYAYMSVPWTYNDYIHYAADVSL